MARRSMALYYFSRRGRPGGPLDRVPGPSRRRGPHSVVIYADTQMLRCLRLGQAAARAVRPDRQQDARRSATGSGGRALGLVADTATVDQGGQRPTSVDVAADPATEPVRCPGRTEAADRRRRFTIAVVVGQPPWSCPYLWVLWDLWTGHVSPLRSVAPTTTSTTCRPGPCSTATCTCPTGTLGIEGFVHDGRTYTYFGIFPSLLRMPVLLFTHASTAS